MVGVWKGSLGQSVVTLCCGFPTHRIAIYWIRSYWRAGNRYRRRRRRINLWTTVRVRGSRQSKEVTRLRWFPEPLSAGDLLLILLLISSDLRLFKVLVNAEDNFKSFSPVENKRHTNAHQPSPPSQQQRLQSLPLLHNVSFTIII